jgi:DNA-binding GntR family transcriptional regulator
MAVKGRNLSADHRFSAVVTQFAGGYKTIGEMVYGVLREAIVTGAFAPGEWLRQEALAEAIGVSRIPVRTALLQLEAEGLVNFHPHRGARVRTLSTAQIDEIYQLRILLEPYAMRLSMARMTPQRVDRLRVLAGTLDAGEDGDDLIETRMLFYREAYDAVRNPLLVEIIEELRGHVGRYLLSFRVTHDHAGGHADLVDHIAAGDLTAAESWLRTHLDDVRRNIQTLVAEENAASDGHRELDAAEPNGRPTKL